MNPLSALGLVAALFVGMILLLEAGRRIGLRRLNRDAEGAKSGTGAVDGAIFALLGLIIAFTFSGAAARFDTRKHLIVDEANSIGTAWLRLDLLPPHAQPDLRALFRRYLDSRLKTYRLFPDLEAASGELAQSLKLQGEIWKQSIAACQGPEGQRAAVLLLPALNQMFDIVTTRSAAVRMHPPPIIFVMLGLLALVSALLAGVGMAGGRMRSWIHIGAFCLVLAVTVYVIVDLEYPRLGFIRVDSMDQVLVDLRQTMN